MRLLLKLTMDYIISKENIEGQMLNTKVLGSVIINVNSTNIINTIIEN